MGVEEGVRTFSAKPDSAKWGNVSYRTVSAKWGNVSYRTECRQHCILSTFTRRKAQPYVFIHNFLAEDLF